jgi:hypothetical protein
MKAGGDFFFETEAKDLPHPLIKKRSQLINGKPGENHHKTAE